MATLERRLKSNVEGDLYVDDTCIDCATCRWMAPATFDRGPEGMSKVHQQPRGENERLAALQALVACPTASIGTVERQDMKPVLASFPRPIADGVYHCGYHAESSFGAASYLIVRPEGNVLVDSPRFAEPLAKRIEALGGIDWMFLTHQDDVADHAKFHERFGCRRSLHEDDIGAGTKGIEQPFKGAAPIVIDDELTIIPTPGHTRGSACLLYREKFLFSGDHVAWSQDMGHIYAFKGACWYSWPKVKTSMKALAEYRFEHILPGHGWPCHFPAERMKAEMQRCLDWM